MNIIVCSKCLTYKICWHSYVKGNFKSLQDGSRAGSRPLSYISISTITADYSQIKKTTHHNGCDYSIFTVKCCTRVRGTKPTHRNGCNYCTLVRSTQTLRRCSLRMLRLWRSEPEGQASARLVQT